MSMQEVGEYLRRLRRARGLKQSEVAQIAGTTVKQIGRWELGQNKPALGTLSYLAKQLGGTVEDVQLLLTDVATIELAWELAFRRANMSEQQVEVPAKNNLEESASEEDLITDTESIAEKKVEALTDTEQLRLQVRNLERQVKELREELYRSLKPEPLVRLYERPPLNTVSIEMFTVLLALAAHPNQNFASILAALDLSEDTIAALRDIVERKSSSHKQETLADTLPGSEI